MGSRIQKVELQMLNYDQVCRPFWYHSAIQSCPMPYKCPGGSVTGNVRYYDVFVVKHPVFQDDIHLQNGGYSIAM